MDEKNFKTKEAMDEREVIDFYDAYASQWDARFGQGETTKYFIERRWRSFHQMLTKIQPQKFCAVELGVGTGVYIDRVAKLFDELTVVDGSKNMLSELSGKLEKQGIKNVHPLCKNVIDLDVIQSNSVDVVYFFGLLEHVIHVDAFAREIHRILKPDGYVIGVTPNGGSPWYRLRGLVRGTGKHCSSDRYYKASELSAVFTPESFETTLIDCWGAVPAGIGRISFAFLRVLEPFLEKSFLSPFLGGLTFCFKKVS